MDTILVPEYICRVCNKHSRSKRVIEQCEKEPYHPSKQVVNVGDKVKFKLWNRERIEPVYDKYIPSYNSKWKGRNYMWHRDALVFKIDGEYYHRSVDEVELVA